MNTLLTALRDKIAEHLEEEKRASFIAQFNVACEGKDTSDVWYKFVVLLRVDPEKAVIKFTEQDTASIDYRAAFDVALAGFLTDTGYYTSDYYDSYYATRAGAIYDFAADAVGYETMADKLIELIKEAPEAAVVGDDGIFTITLKLAKTS